MNLLSYSVKVCIIHGMKILIMTGAILVLVVFSGIYSFLDAHVFAWIPSSWVNYTQTTVAIIAVLAIIAYAILYAYYAFKHADKTTSR